jgi:hypothetical protein
MLRGLLITTALLALSAASASASTLTVSIHDNGQGGSTIHGPSLGKSVVVTAADNTPATVVVTTSTDGADLVLTAGSATALQLDAAAITTSQCRIVTAASVIACARLGVDPSLSSIVDPAPLRFVLGTGPNHIDATASPVNTTITNSNLSAPATSTLSDPVPDPSPATTSSTPAPVTGAGDAAPAEPTARTRSPDLRQSARQARVTRLSAQLASGLDGAAPRALSSGWKIIRSANPTDTFVITLLLPVSGHLPVTLAAGQIGIGKSSVTLKRGAKVTSKQWKAALGGRRLVSRVQIIEPDGTTATASTALHLG